MDNVMGSLTSTMEALPIRVELSSKVAALTTATQLVILEEGEIDERPSLGRNSSSPPPLLEDRSDLLAEADNDLLRVEVRSLHNDLELSVYEYSALEKRYRTLFSQHQELRKLASTYDDIIRGTAPRDGDYARIEQIQAEAGREGLRAKAYQADLLKPIVREAGSIQALASRIQSIKSLIKDTGGLRELQELVADARVLQLRIDEVGGLQGLTHLVSEHNRLRVDQRNLAELKASIDGPNGIKAKALKYDLLQEAFAVIQRVPAVEPGQGNCTITPTSTPQILSVWSSMGSGQPHNVGVPASQSTLIPQSATMMNPARAAMISAAPRSCDPDRDLYEAPPPPRRQSSTMTGSNDVPLGKRRAASSFDQDHAGTTQKQMYKDEMQLSMSKRPRVNVGRASSLLQATLQGKPKSTFDPNYGRLERVSEDAPGESPLAESLRDFFGGSIAGTSAVVSGTQSPWEGRLRERSEQMASKGSLQPQRLPTAKTEVRERY